MTTARDHNERQRMGRAAALSLPPLAVVIPITMPFVGYTHQQTLTWTALIMSTVLVAALVGWFVPWRRWPDEALLVVPLTCWTCLGILGLESDGRAAVYGGYTTLLFLFIGLTQRAWMSLAVLPLGVVTAFLLYGGFGAQLVARLPISITVWLACAEIVCLYRARTRNLLEDLETQAHMDPLTGLGNRNGLEPRLDAMRFGDAALLIDVDHFKGINDRYGHTAGDEVLREFGAVILSVLRGSDHAIRYGGEEILILLTGAGTEGTQALDGRLREAWGKARPDITYSGGIAVVGPGLLPVLARADAAMYTAKARGRNCTIAHAGTVMPFATTASDPTSVYRATTG
jgi:diguanylate cyclase (GGDEF)-like protein